MMTQETITNLGEAPASATAKVKSPKGFSYLFTLREASGAQLMTKLEAFETSLLEKGWTPEIDTRGARPNGSNAPANTKPCPMHEGSTMYERQGRNGPFFSHKIGEGMYCNGKPKMPAQTQEYNYY
jgi:hypothetical protein